MAHGRQDLPNQGLSADARTFFLQFQIDLPRDGAIIVVDDDADFPYTIEKIKYRIDTGMCEITPMIDSFPIDTTESDSTGVITVDQPTGTNAFPDASLDTVGEGAQLAIGLDANSGAEGLHIRFTCRRTEENVEVSGQ